MKTQIMGAAVPQDAKFSRAAYDPLPGMTWDEVAELAKKVLVMIPFRAGQGIQEGLCNHFGFWGNLGLRVATIKDPHGGFIEAVRAGIVRVFLDYANACPEVETLVMIDNDESIDWDAPLRLARHQLPIVTGVVCGMSDEKGIFACFTVKGEDGGAYWPTLAGTQVMPAEGIVPVHQCGTGLLAVHKSVFQTIINGGEIPFYIPEHIRKQTAVNGDLRKSEDICFSDQCEKFGIERYADLSVHATHYKNIGLRWPDENRVIELAASDWKVAGFPEKVGV